MPIQFTWSLQQVPRLHGHMGADVGAVAGCAVAVGLLYLGERADEVRAARRLRGECQRCGYDLRATRDRCPECGTTRAGVNP